MIASKSSAWNGRGFVSLFPSTDRRGVGTSLSISKRMASDANKTTASTSAPIMPRGSRGENSGIALVLARADRGGDVIKTRIYIYKM